MRLALSVLLFLISISIHAQENIAIGQDLNVYLKEHPPKYKTIGPKLLDLPEGTTDFHKYKAQTDDTDIKILIILDKYPVGILQNEMGESKLYYDLSGDGIIETETTAMEVPFWVVASNTDSKLKTNRNNVKPYLDSYYQLFQNDENPYASGKYLQYSKELLHVATGCGIENRDIIYALFCYYRWGNKYPSGALAALDYLANNYFSRFKADHALFYLHFVESLINLGRNEEALKVLGSLLEMDPGFIPAQVYQWQLEKDPEKKKQYYLELKKQYPKHWIVIQI